MPREIASTAAPTTAIPCRSPPAWRRCGLIAGRAFTIHINAIAGRLYSGLETLFERHGITARVQGLGARFGIYFGISREVRN